MRKIKVFQPAPQQRSRKRFSALPPQQSLPSSRCKHPARTGVRLLTKLITRCKGRFPVPAPLERVARREIAPLDPLFTTRNFEQAGINPRSRFRVAFPCRCNGRRFQTLPTTVDNSRLPHSKGMSERYGSSFAFSSLSPSPEIEFSQVLVNFLFIISDLFGKRKKAISPIVPVYGRAFLCSTTTMPMKSMVAEKGFVACPGLSPFPVRSDVSRSGSRIGKTRS